MTPAALLLLLAVAASQVDTGTSDGTIFYPGGEVNLTTCPLTIYGREYTWLDVTFPANLTASFCFKNNQSETAQDCLLFGVQDVTKLMWVDMRSSINPGSTLHQNLPLIKSASPCNYVFHFYVGRNSNASSATLYNFGPQTAAKLSFRNSVDTTIDVKIGNSSMGPWSYAQNKTDALYLDISGCRVSDVAFAAGSDIWTSPEPCSKVICDAHAAVRTVSTCGPTEVCQGNNTCVIPPVVCTVTGSTVIDFHNRVHSVQDRCAYILIKGAEFAVFANFQERRRRDVSFLDHLIIALRRSGVTMYLEQGGRVQVRNKALTLNATAQLLHGVELSKDHTGVTAKVPFSNMTIFFDGNTAHVSGPAEPLRGVCGNPLNPNITYSLPSQRSAYKAAICQIQHNDTVDSAIDCNRSTEHCNLTTQAPFAACHDHIDPEPYMTACTNTLCNYPSVDGLKCQFLEAYAKACSLRGVTLKDWRSTAGCPADRKACRDQYCSDHEFCGEKFGESRCFCRALFASKYKPRNALGEPTVCMQSSATITLAGCLMEDKGIDYSTLHLNDPNCKGHMDDQTHMVTFSYNSSNICGTEVTTNNSQIVYKNSIVTRNSSMYGVITRNDQVQIDFSCFYTKPEIKSVSFRIKDSSVVEKIVSGVWNYTLTMNAYTDPGRMQLVGPSTEIQLNQKIWLELKTEGLDGNMVAIVTDSCWATSQPSANSSLRYDLVIKGCPNPADQTVTMERNGQGTSNVFSFNMFEFSGQASELYLHCKLELCPTQGQSCAPSCGGVKRRKRRSSRSDYADGNPALITMAWSN